MGFFKNNKESKKTADLFLQQINNYDSLLGSFLHEVNVPLVDVEYQLIDILQQKDRIDNKTRRSLENIECHIAKIKALHALLHESLRRQNNASLLNQSKEFINLNTLVEIALTSIKQKYQGLNYQYHYSTGCNIFCNKIEVINAIVHLVDSAFNSFKGNQMGTVIFLTKCFSDEEGHKFSKLEIINDEVVIPIDIPENTFDSSVDEFESGLLIAKKLIEKNQGIIESQSYNFKDSGFEVYNATVLRIIFKNLKKI